MPREDIRGICHRPCIYNDEGRCDMWDEVIGKEKGVSVYEAHKWNILSCSSISNK